MNPVYIPNAPLGATVATASSSVHSSISLSAVAQEGEIARELNGLRQAISSHENILDQLGGRLEPILCASKPSGKDEANPPITSQMAIVLRECAERVRRQSVIVSDWNDRVQL